MLGRRRERSRNWAEEGQGGMSCEVARVLRLSLLLASLSFAHFVEYSSERCNVMTMEEQVKFKKLLYTLGLITDQVLAWLKNVF